ncbi:CrcB family protein [Nocardioides sp. 503]|uniref:fluoride efflux transporter FluC n=1 Tax=Nocardioides sp. 503 TaxID=2508326 RepID=UPI00106FBEE0|nr:CrcB family protein [Nocardioides sp. 503]
MTPPLPRLLGAVAIGGALGALLRYALGELAPDGSGFPWTTLAINVSGAGTLALLPALRAVRRSRVVATALGPGLLGGYTTLSATSEQSRHLLDQGRPALAAAYLLGTLAASLVAVALASRLAVSREDDR